eukprot:3949992-Amphidinium_carterae.1
MPLHVPSPCHFMLCCSSFGSGAFSHCLSLYACIVRTMSASATRLRALLVKEAKVAELVADYVLTPPPNGLGMESI